MIVFTGKENICIVRLNRRATYATGPHLISWFMPMACLLESLDKLIQTTSKNMLFYCKKYFTIDISTPSVVFQV